MSCSAVSAVFGTKFARKRARGAALEWGPGAPWQGAFATPSFLGSFRQILNAFEMLPACTALALSSLLPYHFGVGRVLYTLRNDTSTVI